ncbi:MAG: aldo/keto reductase [Eubacteriales bacterium]|nr:aldo/keto reductase [Eubacteriales bacterium]
MKYIETQEGLRLPRVVLGCMRVADMSCHDLEALVMTAIENGVTHVDHADFYGNFQSEVRFGEVLAENPAIRNQIFLQSKCGIRTAGYYDSSYAHIVESVNNSLKKMNTEYLDCLLIHRPDVLADVDEMARAFEDLEKAGKVRHFGVSNHNPMQIEVLQQALKSRLMFNQMQLSILHTPMIDQGINVNTRFDGAVDRDNGTLEYCKLKHIVLQTWSPFQYGFIEGPFIDNPKFPEVNRVLGEVAQKYEISKTALAVAWLVRLPVKLQVLSGTTKPTRLLEIVKGAGVTLERPDWYAIYKAAGNRLP